MAWSAVVVAAAAPAVVASGLVDTVDTAVLGFVGTLVDDIVAEPVVASRRLAVVAVVKATAEPAAGPVVGSWFLMTAYWVPKV